MLSAVCNEPVSLKVVEEPFYRKGFSPFVNKETGTWWEYDDDKKGFFDTGIIAQGRDGDTVDVRIDGKSIVQDGVAVLPVASVRNYGGIVRVNYGQGFASDVNGFLQAYNEDNFISNRFTGRPLELGHLDYAVKAAMCHGKGAPWTAEEQAAARERMSVENGSDFELLVDATLEEEANSFVVKFPKPVRECLYHIWFFNNNDDKTILNTRCVDSDSNEYCSLRYSNNISKGYGYVLNGYFRYNGNIINHSIVGYAGESMHGTWTMHVEGTGGPAIISYPTNMKLSKVDVLGIYLAITSHVLNVGAKIRIWGR